VELQYAQGMDEDEVQSYFEEIVGDAVREIQLMVNLNGSSNHIVSIQNYSVEKKENEVGWYIFIRMELLTSYNDYVKQHPFSEAEVIKLGCDICDALEVCARKNIIHRDIKPANILVHEESGNFKLGDFGVSRALDGTTGTWSKA
jgi:serine/threonine protein kinase